MKSRPTNPFRPQFAAMAALLAAPFAHAVDGTWLGTSGNWTDAGIWSAGMIADGIDFNANFTGIDIGADQSISLNGTNRTIGNIYFTDATTPSNNLAIIGNTLTLDVASGVPVIDVTQAGRTLSISSIVAGTDGLQKNGLGNLTLTGSNTFTGTTTINGGTLQIGSGGTTGSLYSPTVSSGNLTFGSASLIVNNGALVYSIAGGAVNVNRTISGSGTVNVTGNQAVNFAAGTTINTTGSQTYSATNIATSSARYFGYTLTDNATVALTSSAGNISMTGMLGTANGNTGNLNINTSAGNGNVTLDVAVGVSNVNFGLSSLSVNAGTGTVSLGKFNNLSWGTATTISLTGGAINSTVNKTAFSTLSVTNSSASLFSGTLSSGGALTKSGAGTLTLSAQNSFSGALTINGGIVDFSNAGTLNGGAYNVYGSTQININNGATLRVSGSTSGANIEIFNGRNYHFDSNGGGSFLVGTGNYNANSANFSFTTNGGARNNIGLISTSGAFGMNLGSRVGTFNVALGSDATSDLTITPIINNAGSIVKNGTGRLTLAGANLFTGATTINGGTLILSGAANSSSMSGIAISNSANLTFTATDQRSFTKPITGTAGDITFNVAGNTSDSGEGNGIHFAFNNTGAAFTGNIVINTGLVAPSSDAAFGNAANIIKLNAANGSSSGLVATGNRTLSRSIELVTAGGNGVFRAYDATTLTLGGVISGPGNLVKTDAGTVILNNANTFTGSTKVGLGSLHLGNSLALQNSTLQSAVTFLSSVGSNAFTLGGLSGSNGQTLQNSASAAIALTVGNNNANTSYSGVLSGSGSLVKVGTGVLTLSNTSNYSGSTNVSAGSLIVNGNISTSITTVNGTGTLGGTGTVGAVIVQATGTLAPGNSIGTLNFSNTLSLAGVSNFEIDPTILGLNLNADRANVTNGVTYGGTLNVLYGGLSSDFSNGMVFNLFDASSFSGSFSTVNLPILTGGLTWQNDLLLNGTLTVVPEPRAALLGCLGMLALLRRRR